MAGRGEGEYLLGKTIGEMRAGRVAGAALAAFAVGAPLAAAGVNAIQPGNHAGEIGSAYAEKKPDDIPVMAGEKMFVYVKAGEHLHVQAADGLVTSVTDPDGHVVAVPSSGDFPTASNDGTWTLVMNRYAGNGQDAVEHGLPWNIGAVGADGVEVHGRVWAERIGVRQWWDGDFSESSLGGHAGNITLWTVTDTGYQYKIQFKGYNGLESVITATSSGINKVSTVNGQTVYSPTNQSYNDWKVEPGSGYDAYAPNGGIADVSHWLNAANFNEAPSTKLYKLFFEKPAADLPASIVPSYKQIAEPTVSWEGDSEGVANGYLNVKGLGPDVTYTITAGGKSTDVTGTSSTVVRVDGGSNVDDVKWEVKAHSSSQVHVMLNDVERLGGITITQLNGSTAGDSTVYWDDSTLTQPSHPAKPTSAVSALEGVASDTPSGVHGWLAPDDGTDLGNGNNTYGDGRIVDTWAKSGEAKEWNGSIPVKPKNPHISIVKTVREPEYAEGDTLHWDFKVTNDGETILNDVKVVEDEYTGTNPLTDVSCPSATLGIGESMDCSATSVASAKDVDADKIENTAHPEGNDPSGKRVKGDPSKAVTKPEPKPQTPPAPVIPPAPQGPKPAVSLPVTGASVAALVGGVALLAGGGAAGVAAARRRR